MRKLCTLLFFISCSVSFGQSVLTYREVYDFQPGEVIGRWLNYTHPVIIDPFSPPFYKLEKMKTTDSVLTRTVFAGGDSVRYLVERTRILGTTSGSVFTDTATVVTTVTLEYNYRDVPIVNTFPTPPGNGFLDTVNQTLGGTFPGFSFRYRKNTLVDSSHTWFKGLGGPFIQANISQKTFWETFAVVKKDGQPRLVNPAITVTGQQPVLEGNESICVWPCPAHSELHLKNIAPNAPLSVFDWAGKQVISLNRYDGNALHIASLKAGFYTLQTIGKNNQVSVVRFVKE